MRNRSWSLLFAFLIVVLALAACAPTMVPAGTMEVPAGTVPAAAEDAAAAAEAMIVTDFEDLEQGLVQAKSASGASLDIWADETRAAVMQQIAAKFQAATGVPVNVTELPFVQIRPAFEEAAAAGRGPDIVVGAAGWTDELVADDLLAPIDLGSKSGEYLEGALDAFEVDGTLYGLPYATENLALVYNPTLVPEPPTTWSELAEVAAQLEAEGVVPQGFVRQTGDPYHFYPILSAFGGYLFGQGEDGYDFSDIGIANDGALAAFQWLADMVAAGHLRSDVTIDYDVMHGMFEAGDAAMIVTGPWALPRLRASGVPFVVAPLPGEVQPASPFIGVQGFMVSALADDVDLAERFLTEFVATDAVMQEIFAGDPRPSAYLPLRATIEDPDLYGFALAGENGVPEPRLPAMAQIWDDLNQALEQVSRNEIAPDAAVEQVAAQLQAALEQRED